MLQEQAAGVGPGSGEEDEGSEGRGGGGAGDDDDEEEEEEEEEAIDEALMSLNVRAAVQGPGSSASTNHDNHLYPLLSQTNQPFQSHFYTHKNTAPHAVRDGLCGRRLPPRAQIFLPQGAFA
jgi:hypothetical protein